MFMSKLKVPVNQHDHIQGNKDAPIEVVEYGDFECPYCGEAYPDIKLLKQKMGNDLKFVFRHFPLTEAHAHAQKAALAAEAAGAQGKFWEMHDKLFENQRQLADDDLIRYAEEIGLDVERFKNDLEQRRYLDKVEKDFESGVWSGVNSTPSFYINGEKHNELNEKELMEMVRVH